jgi:hypothetical protein
MRVRAIVSAGAAVLLTMSMVGSVSAEQQAATFINAGSAVFDGFKGNIGQKNDQAPVVGVGYVHAGQADIGPIGDDFVAIGVAKGEGVDNCADDFDAKWSGYYDGRIGIDYFCEDFAPDAYGDESFPTFSIERKTCPLGGGSKWVLSLAGVTRGCVTAGASAAWLIDSLLETTGAPNLPRNIDVRFINLQWSITGSSNWVNYGIDPDFGQTTPGMYTFQFTSVTSHNIFLAPLDP